MDDDTPLSEMNLSVRAQNAIWNGFFDRERKNPTKAEIVERWAELGDDGVMRIVNLGRRTFIEMAKAFAILDEGSQKAESEHNDFIAWCRRHKGAIQHLRRSIETEGFVSHQKKPSNRY